MDCCCLRVCRSSYNSRLSFSSYRHVRDKMLCGAPRGHDESARLLFKTDANINIDILLISTPPRFPGDLFHFFLRSPRDFCFNISFFYNICDQ